MSTTRSSLRSALATGVLASLLLAGTSASMAAPEAAAPPATNTCLDCHRKQDEARLVKPTLHFAEDIHAQRRLGCVSCHGGDATDPDISAMGLIAHGWKDRSEVEERAK